MNVLFLIMTLSICLIKYSAFMIGVVGSGAKDSQRRIRYVLTVLHYQALLLVESNHGIVAR